MPKTLITTLKVILQCLIKLTLLAALAVTLTAGCRKVPANSLSFDDVVYAEDANPVMHELTGGDTLDIPVLGVNDFVTVDSLLIVSTNDNSGHVTVLSLDGRTVFGNFLREGRGPGEVTNFTGVSNIHFLTGENGHLTAKWKNAQNIIVWDITESIQSGKPAVTSGSLNLDGSKLLLQVLPLPGNEYLVAQAGSDFNSIERAVLSPDGNMRITPPLERLNRVNAGKDMAPGTGDGTGTGTVMIPGFNFLNGSYVYCPERGLVIEAERARNSINIFSLDGKTARTVCTYGEQIEDISSLGEWKGDDHLTLYPKAYSGFFSTMHWLVKQQKKYIRLYSYEGVPLAEIPIPHSTSRYSLDPENGHLYLLEPDSETIIRYDIADLRGMLP